MSKGTSPDHLSHPGNPHGGRKEPTNPTCCLLISTCTLWHASTRKHTQEHEVNNSKEVWIAKLSSYSFCQEVAAASVPTRVRPGSSAETAGCQWQPLHGLCLLYFKCHGGCGKGATGSFRWHRSIITSLRFLSLVPQGG